MPFDPDESWTCGTAVDAVNVVVSTLNAAGVLEQGPYPDSVNRGVVTSCQPCRAGGGNTRNCRGWRLELRMHTALRIRGSAGGRNVFVIIEGWQDHQHAQRAVAGEDVAEGSMAMTVIDEEGRLLTRQHSDIANPSQRGAVGHLQLGGLPSVGPRPAFEWLDQPRWPLPPMDVVLLAELALYCFAPTGWESVRNHAVWREHIQRSESLAYTLWRNRFNSYWEQRSARSTWLTEQCNLTTPWQRAMPEGGA